MHPLPQPPTTNNATLPPVGGGGTLGGPPLGAGIGPTQPQGGLQLTNGRQTTVTMAQATPYLGFVAAHKQWGVDNKASITRELKWQRDVTGDMQKIRQY